MTRLQKWYKVVPVYKFIIMTSSIFEILPSLTIYNIKVSTCHNYGGPSKPNEWRLTFLQSWCEWPQSVFFCIFFISQYHFCHFQIGVVITMAHIFFTFSFFGKTKNLHPFFVKNKENEKNLLLIIVWDTFALNLLIVKNHGTLKKSSQFSKVWPEMKKI